MKIVPLLVMFLATFNYANSSEASGNQYSSQTPTAQLIDVPTYSRDLLSQGLSFVTSKYSPQNSWPRMGPSTRGLKSIPGRIPDLLQEAGDKVFGAVFGKQNVINIVVCEPGQTMAAAMDGYNKSICFEQTFIDKVMASTEAVDIFRFIVAHELSHYLLDLYELDHGKTPNGRIYGHGPDFGTVTASDTEKVKFLKQAFLMTYKEIDNTITHAEVDALGDVILLRAGISEPDIEKGLDALFILYPSTENLNVLSITDFDSAMWATPPAGQGESTAPIALEKFVREASIQQLSN